MRPLIDSAWLLTAHSKLIHGHLRRKFNLMCTEILCQKNLQEPKRIVKFVFTRCSLSRGTHEDIGIVARFIMGMYATILTILHTLKCNCKIELYLQKVCCEHCVSDEMPLLGKSDEKLLLIHKLSFEEWSKPETFGRFHAHIKRWHFQEYYWRGYMSLTRKHCLQRRVWMSSVGDEWAAVLKLNMLANRRLHFTRFLRGYEV